MKKAAIYLIPIILIIVYFLFFSQIFKSGEQEVHTDNRMDTVELYITEGRIDSAYSLLQHIITQPKDARSYDSALSLQIQIQKIVLLELGGSHIDVLLQLTGEEYESLLKHTLKKRFLSNPVLNDYYVKKLYEKSIQDSDTTVLRYSDNPKPDKDELQEYARVLRDTYTDLGFEISVTVSGKDYNELVLRSPVFDDTWYAKFDSGGDLEAWHGFGFKRVQIENGAGFVRSKEWDQSANLD